jgi:uncharacterized protein YcbX
MATVERISITPVKGLGLLHPDVVFLDAGGVGENRRFYLVDDRGRLFNGGRHGPLVQVRPAYDVDSDRLRLEFPDGAIVEGPVELDRPVTTNFWDERRVTGRVVAGPFAEALSQYAGRRLRLVKTDEPGAGYDIHPATLVSQASVDELGRRAGRDGDPDARRFRMLFTLAGCEPHEEDTWIGRTLTLGEAVLRIPGPVPRCVVTTQDPETGIRDLDTLRVVRGYRGLRDGRKIDFGIYGDVVEPGRVRLGDSVVPS